MVKFSRIELKESAGNWLSNHLSKYYQGMNYQILLGVNLGNIDGLNSQLRIQSRCTCNNRL